MWQEGLIQLWGPFACLTPGGCEAGKEEATAAAATSESLHTEEEAASERQEQLYLVTIWDPVSRYLRDRYEYVPNTGNT